MDDNTEIFNLCQQVLIWEGMCENAKFNYELITEIEKITETPEYKKMKETLDEVIKILYFYRPQDTMIDESSFDGSIEAMDTIEAVIDRYMAPTD